MARFEENYEILESDRLGRYLVAKRDLARGELILVERPTVVGPHWDSDVCCLNCFRNSCTICRLCRRAPLCYDCTGHDEAECRFYRESNLDINFLFNHFNVVTSVRCLLLYRTDRDRFWEMRRMEAHLEERRGSEIWDILSKYVVEPLLQNGAFDRVGDGEGEKMTVDEDLIQHCCGVFDVNAFEIRGNGTNQSVQQNCFVRGLYPRAALMAHDCVPNAFISVDGESNLRVYAAVPIVKGQMVLFNYTRCLFGTFERRAHLRKGKYFLCTCARCEDPTELGTHLCSVRCTNCSAGLCSYYSKETKWKCDKCLHELTREYVKQVFTNARNDAMARSFEIPELEEAITRHSATLNPRNSLVLELKQTLAGELRNLCLASHPANVPRHLLQRKLELCAELLDVLRVLEPGISRLTAIGLYEYNVSLWNVARKKFETKEISAKELLDNLIKGESGLKQSISMLLFEHPTTPEGHLTKRAMQDLKELREEIAQVRALVCSNLKSPAEDKPSIID
ncbi:SET domain-containing protein SmydA-8 [Culex quinquefasciatus]|uniref:SET domain-containing protein SmydA-8 n=1 Tax=Culex quinquefasciatus TaxID=7176 RepID=UPI0018E2DA73|nr:SET domain-containing protein SmydA-8 [Culex quinquefasciatus]